MNKRKTTARGTTRGKGKAKAAVTPKTRATPRTKQQLTEELASLRQRLAELETVEADSQRIIRAFWDKEEVLGKFMNACPDAFLLFDSKMNYITFNKAAQELAGITLEQAVGKNVTEFVPDIKKSGRYAKYMNVIKTGKPFFAEDMFPDAIFGDKRFAVRAFKVGDGLGLIFTDVTERAKMVEALRKKEAEYEDLAESITDVFFAMDQDLRYTYWNKGSEKLTGITAEDATGKSICEVFPDTPWRKRAENMYLEVLRTQQPRSFINESRIKDKDYFFEISAYPSRRGLSVFVKDITERTQMEYALQEAHTELSAIYASAPMAMILVDHERRVRKANGAAARFARRSVEEMLGLRGGEALRCLNSLDDPRGCGFGPNCDQCTVRRTVIDTFETGNSHTDVEATLPFERDGKREEIQLLVSTSLVGFDTTVSVLVCVQDITERKQAEEELHKSQINLSAVLENTNDPIWSIDTNYHLIMANTAFKKLFSLAYGVDLKEEMPVLEPMTPERQALWAKMCQRALKGEHFSIEQSYNLPQLSKNFGISINPIIADDGRITGISFFGRDITERKMAEEELALRAQLLDNATDAIFLQDFEGNFVYVNDAACRSHGYTREELMSMNLLQLVVPEYHNLIKPVFHEMLRKGQAIFESTHFRKDKSIMSLETHVRLIELGNKKLVLSVSRDITERKQAEQALKESEEKYRSMVENINDVIFSADSQGILTYISPVIEQFSQYRVEEMVGKSFLQFVHPDDLPGLIKNFENTLAGDLQPSEFRVMDKDGIQIYVRSFSRVVIKDGKPAGITGVLTDITERKKAEDALRESEERYRTLAESSLTGIFIVQDGKYVYVNVQFARMHGYKAEELVGTDYLVAIHPSHRDMVAQRASNRLAGKPVLEPFEYMRTRKDGTSFWCEVMARLIEYEGKPAILGNLVDITERKQIEAERAAMEHRSQVTSRLASGGEMAAGIAHEINNPLTGVIGYAELLAEREDLPDDVKKDLDTIDKSAKRVADIVKRLLIFARQTKPSRDYVSIHELIQNTLELRAYQLRTGNITVTTDFDPNLPATVADAGQLQQVFLNIIANAETEMKLSHGRGNLLIKTNKVDNNILISFTDDGPGITRENLEKIFDPFFTTREVGKGTGLGLSICYGIVAEHGGRIWVESEPGQGATFLVELPIVTEMKKVKETEPAEEIREVTGARILVVDDEDVIREFLCRVLTEEGHQVETVDNAEEALEKIQSGRYRLILLDIKMPGMSGIELYRRIQEIAKSLTDRVVFVTGDVMGADTEKFLEETVPRIS